MVCHSTSRLIQHIAPARVHAHAGAGERNGRRFVSGAQPRLVCPIIEQLGGAALLCHRQQLCGRPAHRRDAGISRAYPQARNHGMHRCGSGSSRVPLWARSSGGHGNDAGSSRVKRAVGREKRLRVVSGWVWSLLPNGYSLAQLVVLGLLLLARPGAIFGLGRGRVHSCVADEERRAGGGEAVLKVVERVVQPVGGRPDDRVSPNLSLIRFHIHRHHRRPCTARLVQRWVV
mmetsp:Transcript_31499/g.100400  ORF Transcript_31499/g.100400 Transcript_31499/m.100400 type:complete len:231 (-) Transcript_31499:306-998(-)